ncbi:alcohol acetyltransferase [Microbacterium sp. MPKO10]|uniref:alcohol acetyltransferase n=1 Tax=Microbacterium sp. MPKO10 TaxID=2989818 RepID=UPI00223695D3|nr:alcohol acetyltransferase [Microbacterium sp. MPKO10]MCW4459240.1 alcohol acetyltransferase [Microbacterium sp. MPKO10]
MRRNWVRLDNASNIFLAARSDSDPKVFRISAEMDHDVDPALLQEALDATYDRYPLYHAVLRRGVFWYYLQDSDLRPRVTGEVQYTCAPIYQADRRTLLFRVMHHRQRIILEIFHALSDGTGALWFLTDLVTGYARLAYPDEQGSADAPGAQPGSTAELDEQSGGSQAGESAEPAHGLVADSFAHYFRRRRRDEAPATESDFSDDPATKKQDAAERPAATERPDVAGKPDAAEQPDAAGKADAAERPDATEQPDAAGNPDATERRAGPAPGVRRRIGRVLRLPEKLHLPEKKVYRVPGTRTPDNRTRAVELTMPAKDILDLARAEGVPLTMFLTALFFEAIRLSAGDLGTARTLSASAPVNLRQFFPSTSPRNFFATVRVDHTYESEDEVRRGSESADSIPRDRDRDRNRASPTATNTTAAGPDHSIPDHSIPDRTSPDHAIPDHTSTDDVGTIGRQLNAQFGPKVTPEALEKTLRRFIRLEGMLILRVIPRPLKDVILKLINWGNNRGLSIAVSNLGRVSLPEPAESHVRRMLFHVSAARPQICVMSHAGTLAVSFTSPFVETDHITQFARLLTARGVAVTVAAARVTEGELAEVSA